MDGKPERIGGGYILLARQLLKSGIMEKPPLYLKLWVWMLLQASHTDHGSLKRGQFFTSLSKMQKAMSHKVGFMTIEPTIKEIRGFMDFIRRAQMTGTMKGIRGTLITILNYDHFQDILNYEGHNEGHRRRGALYNKEGINKEGNKENPPAISFQISELEKRYPDRETINQAFQAISSIRKSNRIADSVKLSILKAWERYPVESVMAGIKTFLEKGYHDQGKGEKYLLGIIRNFKPEASMTGGQVMKSTGSLALDDHYRGQGIRII